MGNFFARVGRKLALKKIDSNGHISSANSNLGTIWCPASVLQTYQSNSSLKIKMTSSTDSEDFEVELVQILFRHGDRTPDLAEVYPKDPYKDFDYPPFGYSQLTNVGKQRSFKLGEFLQSQYGTFLGQYKPEHVYAYSTWLDRCKTSLQLVLAGLFPPTPELTWNEKLKWTPIPFEYNPPIKEMFYSHARHPGHADLMNQAYETPEVKMKTEKYEEILDYIVEKTGYERKFQILSAVYQNIQSKKDFGLPMPDWCDEKLFEDLKRAHEIRFDLFTYTKKLKKLVMENFLQVVVRNIDQNVSKNSSKKIYLYSAHDLTVHAFLRAHEINHINSINYSAAVVLEKLRATEDNKQYVRLLYWPGKGDKFEVLKFKDCEEVCPLKKYLEIVHPLLPDDSSTRISA